MLVTLTTVYRAALVVAIAFHVFCMNLLARGMTGVVGLTVRGAFVPVLFALVMLLPLAWAVVIFELPAALRGRAVRRRFERGLCGACGHPLSGRVAGACPECGAAVGPPEPFSIGWPSLRRFALLALAAWLLGCTAAETWAWLDEQAFVAEAEARGGSDVYSRPRRWPMSGNRLWYVPGRGVAAAPPKAD